jgi:BatD DUF11 like domain
MVNTKHLITLLLLLLSQTAFAGLVATLSQTQIGPNDTVTLSIQSDNNLPVETINLSALDADFVVSGRSTSTQISFINGQQTAVRELRVDLTPKREGDLLIPSFLLAGESTAALRLNVSATHQPAAGITGAEPLVLEASVDQSAVYVQQQVVVTIKLYYAVNITDGAIDELTLEGAAVERLGNDLRSQTDINGQRFQVLERRYLVVPEKSGTLQIPSISLRARVASGGNSMLDSFFDRGRAVNVPSQPLTLEVKPKPASFTGATWLPAKAFSLDETLSTNDVRVGDAITRTLRISATGLGSAQLPAISMARTAQFQVYPDQPSRVARADGADVVATLEQKIAIIPSAEGEIELPAIRIPWWDVVADVERVAELPARRIRVSPAIGVAAAGPIASAPGSNDLTVPIGTTAAATSAIWPALSAALLVITLGALWQIRRLNRRLRALQAAPSTSVFQPSPADLAYAENALRRAITNGDEVAASRAVVAVARARGGSAKSLNEVQAMLQDPALQALIQKLETARFAKSPQRVDLSALKDLLQAKIWRAVSAQAAAPAVIPPLYR